jgi:hypothetical protein
MRWTSAKQHAIRGWIVRAEVVQISNIDSRHRIPRVKNVGLFHPDKKFGFVTWVGTNGNDFKPATGYRVFSDVAAPRLHVVVGVCI